MRRLIFLDDISKKEYYKREEILFLQLSFIRTETENELREPYTKYMGDGLLELRIKFSTDITRIFYFFQKDNKIIVTNGFIKKGMKTPKNQLMLAKKYKVDYERRFGYE